MVLYVVDHGNRRIRTDPAVRLSPTWGSSRFRRGGIGEVLRKGRKGRKPPFTSEAKSDAGAHDLCPHFICLTFGAHPKRRGPAKRAERAETQKGRKKWTSDVTAGSGQKVAETARKSPSDSHMPGAFHFGCRGQASSMDRLRPFERSMFPPSTNSLKR